MRPFCFFDHSKTDQNGRPLDWPFKNRTFHASLGRFIYKKYYLIVKRSRLTAIRKPNDWLQTDHSEPFENRTKKGSDFKWVRISSIRNSSPDCTLFYSSMVKTIQSSFPPSPNFDRVTESFEYNNQLNPGLIWYSNGRFVSGCLKTGMKKACLWSKMSGIWMVIQVGLVRRIKTSRPKM